MDRYNCLRKFYPDGTVLTKLYDYGIYGKQNKTTIDGHCAEGQIDLEAYLLKENCAKRDNRERKERENKSRAVQKVYDYAKCNDFRWFITFTVSEDVCDRYNYDIVAAELKKFRKWLSKSHINYIFVPEQHQDGAWHFHGLVADGLKVRRAINAKNGKPLTKNGTKIYNVTNYKSGFSTVSIIQSKERINSYITKYITKCLTVPKGRQRYWVSQGLLLPKEQKDYIPYQSREYFDIIKNADYFKRVDNEYGTLFICEKREADK